MLGEIQEPLMQEFGFEGHIPVAVGSVDGSTAILGAGGITERRSQCYGDYGCVLYGDSGMETG